MLRQSDQLLGRADKWGKGWGERGRSVSHNNQDSLGERILAWYWAKLGKNVARLSVIFNCADNTRSKHRNIGFVSEWGAEKASASSFSSLGWNAAAALNSPHPISAPRVPAGGYFVCDAFNGRPLNRTDSLCVPSAFKIRHLCWLDVIISSILKMYQPFQERSPTWVMWPDWRKGEHSAWLLSL